MGEIPNKRAPHFWFQREYLDQALRASGSGLDVLGTIWFRVDDRARVDPLMREIDDMFRNSEAETASETEKSYFKSFFTLLEGFVVVILLVTGVVALCIVFIAANTASMAVRERFGEIAILKALGFSRRLIFGTLVAEAVLLCTLAGAVGALGSLGLTLGMRQIATGGWNAALGPLGSFIVTQAILVQGLFLGALRRDDLGRRAVLGRGAPQRRGHPARGVLSRAAAALSARQSRRAPPAHGAHGRRDRAGGARHHAVRRPRLEPEAHARHHRLRAQPGRDAQGRHQRRLERR